MAMAGEKFLVHCLLAMLLIALVEGAKELTVCNTPLMELEKQCLPAVTGEHPPAPTEKCCGLIKQANLTCLCDYKAALPTMNINPTQAFALPKLCKCDQPIPPKCKGKFLKQTDF
ncbi:hypothetical protein PTKIN_Ptkin14bG0033200 [Pterospermum kingtungense]